MTGRSPRCGPGRARCGSPTGPTRSTCARWPGRSWRRTSGADIEQEASNMDVKELGHIVLYVKDLETSRGFYRDVLGWKEVASAGGQMAMFSSGRTHHELLLIEVGPNAAPVPPGRRLGLYHFGLKIGTTDDELR